jgi:hypothetical protein
MSRQSLMQIMLLERGRNTYISDSDEICYLTINIWQTSNDTRNIFNRIMKNIILR